MSKQGRELNRTRKAAAIRAEQARRERNRRVALVVGIVVVLGAIVAAGAWYGAGGNDTTATGADRPPVAVSDLGLRLGEADAPVEVVVYEDFQCPYCRELENSTRTFLRENAARGKVSVVYQPLHLLQDAPYSGRALNAWAAVLKNGSPQAALELHDLLYDRQPYEQAPGSVSDSQIADWVKEAGADNAAVRDALATQDSAYFAGVDQLMAAKQIQGTPTVYIDGKPLTGLSVPQMVQQIEDAVDRG